MKELVKELEALYQSDVYPFHMPGHKRNIDIKVNPYAYDITEIDEFDNLHHATGILKKLEKRFQALYKGGEAFLLVNGSSGGILSAISAATKEGDKILIARNSHKSVYHAVMLNHLRVHYLYPEELPFGINGSITSGQVAKAFEENPDIRAVVITSPTYDGVISDLKAISEIVHEHQAVLIVDEAHGAHFGLFPEFLPNDGIRYGDACIVSLHKTLPAPTQSALLFVDPKYIDVERQKFYLNVFQTSSPSYVMMAAMEYALRYCEPTEENLKRVRNYEKNLNAFYEQVKSLSCLRVFDKEKEECFGKDNTKILISTLQAENFDGDDLMNALRKEYKIECEMAAPQYVTALSSFMDTGEGLRRLSGALCAIDKTLTVAKTEKFFGKGIYDIPKKRKEYYEVVKEEMQAVGLREAGGRISGEFCYLYPPGIPVLTPGEEVPVNFHEKIEKMLAKNMKVEGLSDYSCKTIKVLK